MLCPECNARADLCDCDVKVDSGGGRVTGRTVWRAACAIQRQHMAAGISNPVLTTGPKRSRLAERFISTGRVRGKRKRILGPEEKPWDYE